MPPSLVDNLKIRGLTWLRYMNDRAIQGWARSTFRRQRPDASGPLDLQSAREHYDAPLLPANLMVPRETPKEAKLPLSYMLPYYYVTGMAFKLYRRFPLSPATAWEAGASYNRVFPRNKEGWEDTSTDGAFARLRVQGPDPFLLRRVEPGRFEVDYGPVFEGVHDQVVCSFVLDDGHLEPEWIRVGDAVNHRGDEGWERAKLIANALDARYCVFAKHLLNTHLFIGEAYAISAFSLPSKHPLRPFLDLFTYSTLVVNDFAYKLLITPASYFLQSNFISGEDAMKVFANCARTFSLDALIVPKDIAERGITEIPNHPYVDDATKAWDVFHRFVSDHMGGHYPDDASVIADTELVAWYEHLGDLLPNDDVTDKPLTTRERLFDVLTCLLYNNVSHEVCGDFSPFLQSQNPEHKKLVNLERIKQGDFETPASLADVFLMDQGAYAGRFNNAGNNLMTLDVDQATDDPHLRTAVRDLQARLRELDEDLEAINKTRETPFLRMQPRRWEASISF